ncbi:MAG: hypothetical protein UW39_C0006G0016 [Parcubacteria group bacterium GW2011_GWC2_44_17]|uniref:Type II secretion system protein GspG C-terminal domain-containing protein n=1 Tax=Candidatus Jacksonbacteria bacterium RIFCSPLOWO2_02_FULL_44_20 TaxID=1798460 RepID=A0A1G2A864_9BACT|nr:MAG: hypothetical protein UW39_C0006G0016 [Parcubacteria group bacterium GW2011_GWC2_44_17]KKT50551.1 MAG: hypothetical protein UW40_C0002G0011 [Parcubacteria group bacterium GW2011_GWF2_44_17]OGY70971.1 MAG: hypothetical protein A3C00_02430 [Candidatus Jacksonbacteria bacterium RIFCSPHIGHO2_02_FULL_44_25]OGY72676.1 MAG: hypothetical protein A3H61_01640 [Candidatus Jacksonbacteria bacterium RIFCSPLOWO2_02_FULL_44_20]HCA67346.1 hypothetical protein [Candidatus Jacksonbacteria bacterium]
MKTKIKKFIKSESGFTLIELLVVIGIIAILATIGAVNFSGARAKARDGKIVADLAQMRASIEASAAGTADGLYPTILPPDISGANAPTHPRPATGAYCYYVNNIAGANNRTTYIISGTRLEDTGAGAVRDQGLDGATNTSAWVNAPIVINGLATDCPGIAADVPDCDDTAINTLCYQGTTAS